MSKMIAWVSVLVCFLSPLLFLPCASIAQTGAVVGPSDIAPFCGKWAGRWEWVVRGETQSRDVEFTIEMGPNGKPVANIHYAATLSGSGQGARNAMKAVSRKVEPAFAKKDGDTVFSYPSGDGAWDYVFHLVNGRLEGKSTSATGDTKATLKKVSP